MTNEFTFKGRIWVVADASGSLIDDIDTDMIFHNSHLHITDIGEMGKYAFGNLNGWKDFSQKAQPGDIVIAGGNFGCGSSRQQAVDCFRALGIKALIAASFGAIYLRNAINSAFPAGICRGLTNWDSSNPPLANGDEIEADFENGRFVNLTKKSELSVIETWSTVQKDIFRAGGLLKTAR